MSEAEKIENALFLWDMFSVALRIENIEEYENEVLNDSEG